MRMFLMLMTIVEVCGWERRRRWRMEIETQTEASYLFTVSFHHHLASQEDGYLSH